MTSIDHRRAGTAAALLTALVIGLLLVILMPATMFWDQDEGYYARTASEMLKTGNWLVPTFNGELFAHKPPLSYWLMAISMSLFGETEFAARLPSAPAMAGAAFLTFLIGRRMFDARTGWWSMVVLSTAILSAYIGMVAMLDALLLFSVCLSIWAYVEMTWRPERRLPMLVIFALGLYISMLTKGPVGPAVVVTTVAMSWLLLPSTQRVPFRMGVGLVLATFAALGLFMLWLVPANTQSGGDLIAQGAGIHVVGRALSAMEGHGGSGWSGYLATMPVYVPVVILGFLPWMIHMPAAAWALWNGRIGERRERLVLWSWIVPTFVMFTLAATKLPHYVFPMFPPVAIAIAATMVASGHIRDATLMRWLRVGGWLYLGSGAIGAIAVLAAPILLPGYVSWLLAVPIALALFAAFLAVGLKQISDQPAEASRLIVYTIPFVLVALIWVLVPPVEPAIKAAKPLGQAIARVASPDTRVYGQGYFEPSFVFYVNRPFDNPVIPVRETDEGTARVLADEGDVILVTTEPYFEAAQREAGDRPFEVIARYEARNVNRGARLQQLVVARRAATAQ